MTDTSWENKLALAKQALFSTTALLFAFLLVMIVVGGLVQPAFLQPDNLLNIARIVSLSGVVAIGMTFVLLIGEIDLSLGSTLSLSAVAGGLFMDYGTPAVMLITCLTGITAGLVNGLLVVKSRAPSLIITIGTLIVYGALASIICGGQSIYPYSLTSYIWIGQGYILGIPVPVVIFCGLTVAALVVLNLTSFGRWVYYYGANRKAALLSGGRNSALVISTFMISGFCASLAGPMISAQINRIWPTEGAGYELAAVSIAVLGGNSLWGGQGTVLGTFIAALIFGSFINLMNLTSVGTYLQAVVKGGLLILIVVLMRMRELRERTGR